MDVVRGGTNARILRQVECKSPPIAPASTRPRPSGTWQSTDYRAGRTTDAFGRASAERRSRGKDRKQILVRVHALKDALRGPPQPAQRDKPRGGALWWRLKNIVAGVPESQRAQPGLVRYLEQEVALLERAHGSALALGVAPFPPAHQGAAPGIGSRVGHRTEEHVACQGAECPRPDVEKGVDRIAVRRGDPFIVI